MPILVLFIILTEKSKKQIPNNLESVNQEAVQKVSLISHIYIKNRWIWLKTIILAIIFVPIYISMTDASGMGMAALGLPFVLAPFIITGVLVTIAVVLKFIFSILGYYSPNQKKFHISGWVILIIIIVLAFLNYATPFIRNYFRQPNQTNQNTQINSQANDDALSIFVKATFRIKDTNETFSYIEKYVPNVHESYDYDPNAVSNCISWDLQGDFLCKKVYFIENGFDKKRLAVYNEKSDAVSRKDKVIEAEMVSYQEYKYGEVSPVVNVK